MSRPDFWRAHARAMRAGTPADHAQRVSEAFVAVRDAWIAQGHYQPLARVILANWTSGNCADFMAPLTSRLLAAGCVELHRHLWTRTVKRQVDKLFHVLGSVAAARRQFVRLYNLDTQGFREADPAAWEQPERAAAFLLKRLCRDLGQWRAELLQGGLPSDDPEGVERCLLRLEKPRIRVNKMPPEASTIAQ